jgi:hypothetical protein
MSRYNPKAVIALALAPLLALGACTVAPPTGPSVMALPGQGKTFPQFQQDDQYCRNYAQSRTSNAGAQAANASNDTARTAVVGTLIGAAAGAVLGSLSGNVGAGAGIGAGAGLLGGSAVAGGQAQNAADSLQGQYDVAYAQCMVGYGNTVQAQPGPGYYGPPPGYYAPY